MSDLVGKKLGQYEITGMIARGGMATVYLGRQPSINRTVAIKVLSPHYVQDETFVKRFQREVQAVARLQHPRIIPVHDYGEEDGTFYIVMAHIEGGSLAELIKIKGQLLLPITVQLMAQIAEGLDFAHKQGIIHRDFKPSNVLIDHHGNAYLSDFGIAKVSQETVQLTGSGIVGTPTYMAPEMFRQEDSGLPAAVDIYALGVTLFQMLSGDVPYGGTTPVQLMYAHLNMPVPSIEGVRKDVPPEIQIVLDRAMAKNPADRYKTAGAMAAELKKAAAGDLPAPDLSTMPIDVAPAAASGKGAAKGTPKTKTKTKIAVPAPPTPAEPAREAEIRAKIKLTTPEVPADSPFAVAKAPVKVAEKPRRRNMWILWLLLFVGIIFFLCRAMGAIGSAVGQGIAGFMNDPSNANPTSGDIAPQELNGATALDVTVSLGTGEATIEEMTGTTLAAQGHYSGRGPLSFTTDYQVRDGTGEYRLIQVAQEEGDGFLEDLTLQLTDAVPVSLTVNAGAGEATLDLEDMQIQSLHVKGGVGKFTVILPFAGEWDVDITAGVGETVVLIPGTVEVRLDVTSGFSNIDIVDTRFIKVADGVWETPGYQDAAERGRVSITAGVGNVVVDKP